MHYTKLSTCLIEQVVEAFKEEDDGGGHGGDVAAVDRVDGAVGQVVVGAAAGVVGAAAAGGAVPRAGAREPLLMIRHHDVFLRLRSFLKKCPPAVFSRIFKVS